MSDLASKLETHQEHQHARARRRLSTLVGGWGFRVEKGDSARPVLVSVCPMDRRTWWRRVDGDTSKDPLFELERETDEHRATGAP